MRVFVTGGTGYIGTRVARVLKARGHAVTVLVRRDDAEIAARAAGYEVVRGGLEDAAAVARGALESDAVVHTANTGDDRRSVADVGAVRAMLGAMRGTGKRFVYTGGCWSYGNTGPGPVDELAPTTNGAQLSAWRGAVEAEVMAASAHNVRVVVMRPVIVYGEQGGLVAMLANQARKQGALRYVGTPATRWTFVHVLDLANLYALVVEHMRDGATILNGAADDVVTLGDLTLALGRAMKVDRIEPWAVDDARKTMGAFADALALDQSISGKRARQQYKWTPAMPKVLEDVASFARA